MGSGFWMEGGSYMNLGEVASTGLGSVGVCDGACPRFGCRGVGRGVMAIPEMAWGSACFPSSHLLQQGSGPQRGPGHASEVLRASL